MNRQKVRILVETGVMLGLAFVLSYFRVGQMPQGGSVSLQMIPIFVVALRWGFKAGTLAGIAFGFLKIIGPGFWPGHWAQILLDYPIAFGLIGVAGLLRFNSYIAIVVASFLRFLSHFIAGMVFFGHYAPEGISAFTYSLVYNATYMIPEILLVIFITPYIVSKLKDLPQNNKGEEKLIFLSLVMPLLMITAFTGRVDNHILRHFTDNYDTQLLIMTILKAIISIGWVGVFGSVIYKFIKEKVKAPLIVLVNTQLVVVIGYFMINYFIN